PADLGDEPAPCSSHRSGPVPETETVEQGGTPRTGRLGARSLGPPPPAGPARTARSAQPLDRRSGPGGDAGSAKSSGSAALNEGARSGARDGIGVCVDDRSGRPFPEKQSSGELPGSESQ